MFTLAAWATRVQVLKDGLDAIRSEVETTGPVVLKKAGDWARQFASATDDAAAWIEAHKATPAGAEAAPADPAARAELEALKADLESGTVPDAAAAGLIGNGNLKALLSQLLANLIAQLLAAGNPPAAA